MKSLAIALLTGVISASASPVTSVGIVTGDSLYVDYQGKMDVLSASSITRSPSYGSVFALSKGAISVTWLNDYQANIKGWYYQWLNPYKYGVIPQYPVVSTQTSAGFTIPATWGNYTVSGYVHDAFNTSTSGPGVVQVGYHGCQITGTSGYSTGTCSFQHAHGTTEDLDIQSYDAIDQFASTRYGWYNLTLSDPPIPTAASATPEPSSFALIGLSAIGAGIAFRKKLKR